MRTLFIILIFIILFNCLRKNNKLEEGIITRKKNEDTTNEDTTNFTSKCSSFKIKQEIICDNECNSEKYKLNEDELLDTDDNKPETFKKMIIKKVKEIITKINNCDLCMYCKLLQNKIARTAPTYKNE